MTMETSSDPRLPADCGRPFDHPSFEGRRPHRGPETSGESRPAWENHGGKRFEPLMDAIGKPLENKTHRKT